MRVGTPKASPEARVGPRPHHRLRHRWAALVSVLTLAPACLEARSYDGLLCDRASTCPTPYVCGEDGRCHRPSSAADEDEAQALDGGASETPKHEEMAGAPNTAPTPDGGPANANALIDPGCDEAHPARLWPVAADVPTCMNGKPTIGPNAPEWTVYNGCAHWLEFETTPGAPIRFDTNGDGCECAACVLFHIAYDILEDLGQGLRPTLHVEVPDAEQCPGGKNVQNTTLYTPRTRRVRMLVQPSNSGRQGFYFRVCGAR